MPAVLRGDLQPGVITQPADTAFAALTRPFAALTGGFLLASCMAAAQPGDSHTELPRADGAPVRVAVPVAGNSVDVSLEALLNPTPPALDVRRNLFRFGPAEDGDGHDPPRTRPAAPLPAHAGRLLSAAGAAAARVAPPALQGASPVRFIGIVEVRDRRRRVAVLAGGGGVHHGGVEDVVLGRYRITALGASSVELEDVAHGTRLVLRPGRPGPADE